MPGCVVKDSITIKIKPTPDVTITAQTRDTICEGAGNVRIFTSPAGGTLSGSAIYGNFFFPDSAIVGQYNLFYYTYRDTNGCVGTAVDSLFVMACDGIKNITGNNGAINVYPNPFTNSTTLLVNSYGKHYLELDDITGRELKSIEFTGNEYILSTDGLAKGMYFIRVYNNDNTMVGTSKLVVQ